MGPIGVEFGRQLNSTITSFFSTAGATEALTKKDSNRVALSISAPAGLWADAAAGVAIIVKLNGTMTPVTVLTHGHPTCYLSVDKIGSAVMEEFWVQNSTGDDVTLGVVTVRQVHQVPKV